jgi:hypothetical protein
MPVTTTSVRSATNAPPSAIAGTVPVWPGPTRACSSQAVGPVPEVQAWTASARLVAPRAL